MRKIRYLHGVIESRDKKCEFPGEKPATRAQEQ